MIKSGDTVHYFILDLHFQFNLHFDLLSTPKRALNVEYKARCIATTNAQGYSTT
jgi:hypothetical protein